MDVMNFLVVFQVVSATTGIRSPNMAASLSKVKSLVADIRNEDINTTYVLLNGLADEVSNQDISDFFSCFPLLLVPSFIEYDFVSIVNQLLPKESLNG